MHGSLLAEETKGDESKSKETINKSLETEFGNSATWWGSVFNNLLTYFSNPGLKALEYSDAFHTLQCSYDIFFMPISTRN